MTKMLTLGIARMNSTLHSLNRIFVPRKQQKAYVYFNPKNKKERRK